MEYIALAKNVPVTPRKARIVAAALKGFKAEEALARLPFLAKAAALPIFKAIKSAAANAKKDNLKIKTIMVDEGFKMKRRDTSHGARYSGGLVVKRKSHIKVVLTD